MEILSNDYKMCYEANKKTEQLVESVLEELREFSDENYYEYLWILDEFRREFIEKTRKLLVEE